MLVRAVIQQQCKNIQHQQQQQQKRDLSFQHMFIVERFGWGLTIVYMGNINGVNILHKFINAYVFCVIFE